MIGIISTIIRIANRIVIELNSGYDAKTLTVKNQEQKNTIEAPMRSSISPCQDTPDLMYVKDNFVSLDFIPV